MHLSRALKTIDFYSKNEKGSCKKSLQLGSIKDKVAFMFTQCFYIMTVIK